MKSPMTQRHLDRYDRLIVTGQRFSPDSDTKEVDRWREEVNHSTSTTWGVDHSYSRSLKRAGLYDNNHRPQIEGLEKIINLLIAMKSEIDTKGVPGVHFKLQEPAKIENMNFYAERDNYVQKGGINQKQIVNNSGKEKWLLVAIVTAALAVVGGLTQELWSQYFWPR